MDENLKNEIREELRALIERKSTEVRRANDSKISAVRDRLEHLNGIELFLTDAVDLMNEQLTGQNKILKVKGNTEELLLKLNELNPDNPEMIIPNKKMQIGIGYVNAKHAHVPAYAKAKTETSVEGEKVSILLNDKPLWSHDHYDITERLMKELLFKMLDGAKW